MRAYPVFGMAVLVGCLKNPSSVRMLNCQHNHIRHRDTKPEGVALNDSRTNLAQRQDEPDVFSDK